MNTTYDALGLLEIRVKESFPLFVWLVFSLRIEKNRSNISRREVEYDVCEEN